MTYFRTLASTTALAGLVAAGAARADVTPEQAWQGWQQLGATYGQSLTAQNQTRSGDTLKVENIRVHFAQQGVLVEGLIPEADFTQRADGKVEITLSPEFPLEVTVENAPVADPDAAPDAPPPQPTKTHLELAIRQPGLVAVASGEGSVSAVEVTAPSSTVTVTGVDGKSASELNLVAEATLSDLSASYRTDGVDARHILSDFKAAVAEIHVATADPEKNGTFNLRASTTDLKGSSEGKQFSPLGMADMAAALRSGASSTGEFTYGPATLEFDFKEAANTLQGSSSAAGGNLTVGLSKDGLAYGGSTRGLSLTAKGSQIPFPQFNLSFAEAAFDLLIPITRSESPQPFRLLNRLVDLKVSDEIWALFDPQSQLPRDPATLVVDVGGTATLDVDVFDTAAVDKLGPAAPGKFNSFDVNELKFTVAGAALTGKGAFTLDNADTVTYGGFPAPTGKADLRLTGGNGLIDKLVAIGILPQDQAMGARMMLGMFARPGDGQDTLTSTLEFKDKGFFANGQRLQ